MSVQFTSVVFHNNNGIPVTLSIEAPPGTRVSGPQVVPMNSTATIPINRTDIASVLLAVDSAGDPDETEKQTFSVTPPLFIKSLDVAYLIGSFDGTITSGSGQVKATKMRRQQKPK